MDWIASKQVRREKSSVGPFLSHRLRSPRDVLTQTERSPPSLAGTHRDWHHSYGLHQVEECGASILNNEH